MVWLHNFAHKETIQELMNHATKVYEMNNNFLDRNIHYVFFCKQSILEDPLVYLNEKQQKGRNPKTATPKIKTSSTEN